MDDHSPTLWERVQRARVVQVLALYLGASWVVIQVADTFVDALNLPASVMPVTLLLLLVGMVVVLATALIQSLPSTTAREEAGELPSDWEIAPRDALASVMAGRMPHLTWGRVLAGGAMGLSLLFAGAGMYVGLGGGRLGLGAVEASASEAAAGIAVVPFDVRGSAELDIWREGMMDVLTNGLDDVGGFRTIDARTLMARWKEQVGDAGAADLEAILRVARATGALYAVEGSLVGVGENVRLVTNVYDVQTGRKVAAGQAEGPAAEVIRLGDELAVETMRSLLAHTGRTGTQLSTETITTRSLPALRAFLEGESHYRNGDYAAAIGSYEAAVAADSVFAIALVRLAEAYGWLESAGSERMLEVGERAVANAHRLSPRYQFIIKGWDALNRGTADGLESLKEAVRRYPDDPEAWFLLAETYIHVPGPTYSTLADVQAALGRAMELDPGFAPYLVHVADNAVLRGDRAAAEAAMERYETLTGDAAALAHVEFAIPILLGDEGEAEAALEALADGDEGTLGMFLGEFGLQHDHFGREARVAAALAAMQEEDQTWLQGSYAVSQGHVERGAELMASRAVTDADRTIFWADVNGLWNVQPPHGALDSSNCMAREVDVLCQLFVGLGNARLGRWRDHERSLSTLREAANVATEAEDVSVATDARAAAAVVEGAGVWRRGDVEEGRRILLEPAGKEGYSGEQARLEMAWLEVAAGRPDQALRYFRSGLVGWARPLALYGMASMHEQMGKPAEARPYWQSLLTLTAGADELPRLQEAREALARSAGEAGGR